jgi:hypothetical protein
MIIPLQAGGEAEDRMALLLLLIPKFSDNTKAALTAHFVQGYDVKLACSVFNIKQPNFQVSINKLNQVNDVVEQIKNGDLYGLSHINSITKQGAHA